MGHNPSGRCLRSWSSFNEEPSQLPHRGPRVWLELLREHPFFRRLIHLVHSQRRANGLAQLDFRQKGGSRVAGVSGRRLAERPTASVVEASCDLPDTRDLQGAQEGKQVGRRFLRNKNPKFNLLVALKVSVVKELSNRDLRGECCPSRGGREW